MQPHFQGRGAFNARGGSRGGRGGRREERPALVLDEKPDHSPIGGVIGTIVRLGDVTIKVPPTQPGQPATGVRKIPVLTPTDTAVYSETLLTLDAQITQASHQLRLTLDRDSATFIDILLRCVASIPTKTVVYAALVADITSHEPSFSALVLAELSKRLSTALRTLVAAGTPPLPAGGCPHGSPAAVTRVHALVSTSFGAAAPSAPTLDAPRLQLRLLTRFATMLAALNVAAPASLEPFLIALLASAGSSAAAADDDDAPRGLLALLPALTPAEGSAAAADAVLALACLVPAPANAGTDDAPAASSSAVPAACVVLPTALADAVAGAVLDSLAHALPLLDLNGSPAAVAVAPAVLPAVEAWLLARRPVGAAHPLLSPWLPSAAVLQPPHPLEALFEAFAGRAPAAAALALPVAERYPALARIFSVLSPSRAALATLVGALGSDARAEVALDAAALAAAAVAGRGARVTRVVAARALLASAAPADTSALTVGAADASAAAVLSALSAPGAAERVRVLVLGAPAPARAALPPASSAAAAQYSLGAHPLDLWALQQTVADLALTFDGLREEQSQALLTLPPLVRPAAVAAGTAMTDAAGASSGASDGDSIYSSACWGASAVLGASLSPLHLVVDALISLLLAPAPDARPTPAAVSKVLVDLILLEPAALPARLGPRVFALYDALPALTPAAARRLANYLAFHFTNLGFGWPWDLWRSALAEPLCGPHSLFVRQVIDVALRLSFFDLAAHNVPSHFHALFPARPEPFDYLATGQAVVAAAAGANPSLPPPASSMVEASAVLSAALEAVIANRGTAADVAHLAADFAARAPPGAIASHGGHTDPATVAANARARSRGLLAECVFLGVWPSLRAAIAPLPGASAADTPGTGATFAPGAGPAEVHPALLAVISALLRRGKATYTHAQVMLDRYGPALEAVAGKPTPLAPAAPTGAGDAAAATCGPTEAVAVGSDGSVRLLACAGHWALLDSVALYWRASRQHGEVLVPRLVRAGVVSVESALTWLLGPAPPAGYYPWGPCDPALWATVEAILRLAFADLAGAAQKVRAAAEGASADKVAVLAPQLAAAAEKILQRQAQLVSGTLAALAALRARAPELASVLPAFPPGVAPTDAAAAEQAGAAMVIVVTERIDAAVRELLGAFSREIAECAAYLAPQAAETFGEALQWVYQC